MHCGAFRHSMHRRPVALRHISIAGVIQSRRRMPGKGDPGSTQRGACATVSGVSGGVPPLTACARRATQLAERRPAPRLPPVPDLGQGGEQRHVLGRQARRPGRPRRAPLELARDDVALHAHLDRGRREAVAAEPGRLRRQPARDALALVAVAGPDRDRAAAAVARGDADGGVGVRHLDDGQRQALGGGEARVVGREAVEDLRLGEDARRARTDVGVLGPRVADLQLARRPRAAPRPGPARRPRPSRAARPRRDGGPSRRTRPTGPPRPAGPSARPRARPASRAAPAAAGR